MTGSTAMELRIPIYHWHCDLTAARVVVNDVHRSFPEMSPSEAVTEGRNVVSLTPTVGATVLDESGDALEVEAWRRVLMWTDEYAALVAGHASLTVPSDGVDTVALGDGGNVNYAVGDVFEWVDCRVVILGVNSARTAACCDVSMPPGRTKHEHVILPLPDSAVLVAVNTITAI